MPAAEIDNITPAVKIVDIAALALRRHPERVRRTLRKIKYMGSRQKPALVAMDSCTHDGFAALRSE